MNEKARSPVKRPIHGNLLGRAILDEAPHLASFHESMSLHELEQVVLDMRANDAVGPDYRARVAVHDVPRTPYLRPQPALQRPEQIRKRFANALGASHALALGQLVERLIPDAPALAGAWVPARPFDDDLVHV